MALQLIAKIDGMFEIIYENPHLNSSYGVRPLRMWFVKETNENATHEINRLKSEANQLKPLETISGIKVCFCVIMSMCDMKIENLKWGNRSAMRCPFCLFSQKFFHEDLDFLTHSDRMTDLCFSILHFLIRFFEHFLKVFLAPQKRHFLG